MKNYFDFAQISSLLLDEWFPLTLHTFVGIGRAVGTVPAGLTGAHVRAIDRGRLTDGAFLTGGANAGIIQMAT